MTDSSDETNGVRWLTPDWPAPAHVHAASTLRGGGVSRGEFASLNLGAHVGDDPARVAENRRRLRHSLKLPTDPLWLNQVHGTTVVCADAPATRAADAAWTRERGLVCAVLTADCLPILLCDRQGRVVAAVHAGWRGLAAGVVEATIAAMDTDDLMAWLGPAIGPRAFEVGAEVYAAFRQRIGPEAASAFHAGANRWHADLYALARLILERSGVAAIYGGSGCTYSEPERFFSYRREGRTGRMASLIWMT